MSAAPIARFRFTARLLKANMVFPLSGARSWRRVARKPGFAAIEPCVARCGFEQDVEFARGAQNVHKVIEKDVFGIGRRQIRAEGSVLCVDEIRNRNGTPSVGI